MIYVFFANGFEEVEAVATVDMLRRAELEVCTVGVGGVKVAGAHGIVMDWIRRLMQMKHLRRSFSLAGCPAR